MNISAIQISERDIIEEWLLPLEEIEDPRLVATRIFMTIWLTCTVLLGIPGNILIIAVVVMFKHLREVPHLLVINLAVSDLGVMLMSGLELIGVFYGDTFLPKYPLLCEFSGVLCMSCCFASLWTMMFIAINRCMFICKQEIYDRFFGLKGTLLCIALIWITVFLIDLPNFPFMGLAAHEFNPFYLHCTFKMDG
ncbi:melatonin receptor type 1B-A-like [Symsagittifera roscoffensis]|uniref:melatonin receptor type 1B-A-like n=1 Tax=Symsagittifera roscoffensis TaxID=84072 RepID=UPI00307B46A3